MLSDTAKPLGGRCRVTHADTIETSTKLVDTPLQNALKDYFQQWPWEVLGTFSLRSEFQSNEAISEKTRLFARRFGKATGLRLAYTGLIAEGGCRKHFHLLLMGKNRHGETLRSRLRPYLTTLKKGGKEIECYKLPARLADLWEGLSNTELEDTLVKNHGERYKPSPEPFDRKKAIDLKTLLLTEGKEEHSMFELSDYRLLLQPISDIEKVAGYVGGHNAWGRFELLHPYGAKLLQKTIFKGGVQ